MQMSCLNGAPTKCIWISSLESPATERDGPRWPDTPRGENQQEAGMKERERGWHNGLEPERLSAWAARP